MAVPVCIPINSVRGFPFSPHPLQLFVDFFIVAILTGRDDTSLCFYLHFSSNEWCCDMRKLHIFSCVLLALCISSLEKCLFTSLVHFLIELFIFLVLSCMNCLYILELNSLSVVSFVVIVFHSEGCLSTWLIVSFVVQKLVSLPRSHLYFCFYFHYSARWVIENLAVIYIRGCYASVFL